MKLKKPENPNYCMTVVKVGKDITLEGRDRIVHKNIFGNMVITQKDSLPEGTLALYIPAECQLSEDYCKYNNLYDKAEMNVDTSQKGYISYKKRRIRAISLGGYESNGMLMPISSLYHKDWLPFNELLPEDLKEGDEFDEINGIKLCQKYVPQIQSNQHSGNTKSKGKQPKKISKLVDNQFRFHQDTTQLGKNIHHINPDDVVSITYKLHGTSGISSRVLVKRKLSWLERLAKKLGANIQEFWYDNEGLFASRATHRNNIIGHTPKEDERLLAHKSVMPYLSEGMTAYYEIVGYTPGGKMIQKGYDYGYINPITGGTIYVPGGTLIIEGNSGYEEDIHFGVYIYRLTYTNTSGQVFEFSAKQVQEWCKLNGLKAVPELYYGTLNEYYTNVNPNSNNWNDDILEFLRTLWYKQCTMCKNKVPSEGIVLRKEGLGLEVYKYKNFDFLKYESDQLDTEQLNEENNG